VLYLRLIDPGRTESNSNGANRVRRDRSMSVVNVAAAEPTRQREKVDRTILMTAPAASRSATLTKDDYQYGFSDPEQYSFKSRRGLDADVVRQISAHK
jgi:hypothetical protein